MHRGHAGFDFEVSPVDRALITKLAAAEFLEPAHNVGVVGGPGKGKTPLASAIGIEAITRHGQRVRFLSTVDLVNALEQEKAQSKAGRIAGMLLRLDLVVLNGLATCPSARLAGRCCSTCCPRCMSTPA